MSSEQKRLAARQATRRSRERRKLGAIVVLACVLVGVLVVQFRSEPEEFAMTSEGTRDVSLSSNVTPIVPTVVTTALPDVAWMPMFGEPFATTELPARTINQILDFQPRMFDVMSSERHAARQIADSALSVRAIYSTSSRGSALVDDQIVQAGDSLADGRQLVAVGPAGLQIKSPPLVSRHSEP